MFKARKQRSKRKSRNISTLNAAIDILNATGGTIEILPVKGILGSVVSILTLIKVSQTLCKSIPCSQCSTIKRVRTG